MWVTSPVLGRVLGLMLLAHFAGQPIGPIFKGQAFHMGPTASPGTSVNTY
jgi:hypothetical protein